MRRYDDRELAKMGKEYDDIAIRIKKLKAMQEKRKMRIIAELEARGTDALEANGVRVTRVQSQTVKYDDAAIVRALTREQRKAVMVRSLDISALSRAVQAGTVDGAIIDRYSTIHLNAPYIAVSGTDK